MKDFVTNHKQIIDKDEKQVHFALFVKVDPIIYEEASHDKRWQKAMAKKIESIKKNETWELLISLQGMKLLI